MSLTIGTQARTPSQRELDRRWPAPHTVGLPLPRAARAYVGGPVLQQARLTGAREHGLWGRPQARSRRRAPASWGTPKRLAERIRANVTSGVAESREIRSNVEWQLSPRVSMEGSYDNVNDVSSSSLGNLGADVRWRMEFE